MKVPNVALVVNERRQRLGNEDGNGRQVQEGLWNEGGTDTPPNPPSRRRHTRIMKRHCPGKHYGDILTDTKSAFILRVACGNPNTLSANANHWQNDDICKFTNKFKLDILGFGEVNRYWPNMDNDNQFQNRFRGRWESLHTRSACNKTEKLKRDSQIRGTAMFSVNEASHRVNMSGSDESGLGRWVWTRYVGKGGKHLRVNYFDGITPTPREAVYLQQYDTYTKAELKIAILSTIGIQPHDRFPFDLEVDLQHWQDMGDQIILMGDLNHDNVCSSKIVKFFEDLSMRELITGTHNSQKAPNTYNRGSKPINGIWATFHLKPHCCGYTAFNHGCGGDHRITWAEFAYKNAYGHDMPVIERPIARRLRLHDPCIVAKFNELREENVVNIIWQFRLSQTSNGQHIHLLPQATRSMKKSIACWWQAFDMQIKDLIKALLTRRQHNKISFRYIQHLDDTKLGDDSLHYLDEEALWKAYRKGQRDHREICNNVDEEHRLNFLVDLANARAETNDTNPETELSNLQGWELQRRIHAKIRAVSGWASRPSLTRLTREVTLEDGTTKIEEAVEPEDLAIFGAEEYEGRVHLTETSDLMQKPMLVTDLGHKGTTATATAILYGTYVPPPGQDPYTTAFLQQLSCTSCEPAAHVGPQQGMFTQYSITTAQHIDGWKRSKERTAPGLSGLITAHWKAACKKTYLAMLDTSWANYPYVTGYSPERWRNGVDILIPKKVFDTKVESLRPILLFEVDCNQNNK
eukprot:scaffold368430_cov59-Attheya_sp.AAC.5